MIIVPAICLAAIQLLPTLELAANSTRQGGIGSLALDSLPFHPRNISTLIYPYIFGDPGKGNYPHFGGEWGMFWENNLYFGLTAFLLAIFSLVRIMKDKKIFSLWITAGILLLLILGKYSPLFPVYYLPVFNFFRVTGRFSFALLFFLCLLAAYSFEAFLGLVPPKFRFMAGIALTAVLVTELFVNGFGYNPTAAAKNFAVKPQALEYIEKGNRMISLADSIIYDKINANGWRNNIDSNIGHLNSLGADANILWNIQNSDIYSGLFLENNRQWQSVLFQNIFLDKNGINIASPSMKMLSLANVCSLMSGYQLSNAVLLLRGKITKNKQAYFAYDNSSCLPKGLLYDNAIAADSAVQQRILLSGDFDPKKHLLIDSIPFGSTSDRNSPNESMLNLIEQDNGYYKFKVSSGKNRWLLLQETYFPGWNAYVNGINRPLAKADLTFMAANIPAGDSEVIFTYQPFSFYLGAVISAISLILLLSFALFSKRIYTAV